MSKNLSPEGFVVYLGSHNVSLSDHEQKGHLLAALAATSFTASALAIATLALATSPVTAVQFERLRGMLIADAATKVAGAAAVVPKRKPAFWRVTLGRHKSWHCASAWRALISSSFL